MEACGEVHASAVLPAGRYSTTDLIGAFVGFRGVRCALEKRKFSCPCRDSNPRKSNP